MRVASSRASRTIVRDEDGRLAEARAQRQKLLLHLEARHRIERAERLVEQQQRRIGRQRARHAHALPLAAGKLARIALRELLGRQVEHREQFAHARVRWLPAAQPSSRGTRPTFCATVKCGNRPTS